MKNSRTLLCKSHFPRSLEGAKSIRNRAKKISGHVVVPFVIRGYVNAGQLSFINSSSKNCGSGRSRIIWFSKVTIVSQVTEAFFGQLWYDGQSHGIWDFGAPCSWMPSSSAPHVALQWNSTPQNRFRLHAQIRSYRWHSLSGSVCLLEIMEPRDLLFFTADGDVQFDNLAVWMAWSHTTTDRNLVTRIAAMSKCNRIDTIFLTQCDCRNCDIVIYVL